MCDAPACTAGAADGLPVSVFVSDDADVYDVPMKEIRRPLMSTVDEAKVEEFMQKIKGGVQMTPIEVAWVQRPEGNYYFSFGGCHRWAAHERLRSPTIRAKLIRVAPATITTYMGASSPFRNQAPAEAASSASPS